MFKKKKKRVSEWQCLLNKSTLLPALCIVNTSDEMMFYIQVFCKLKNQVGTQKIKAFESKYSIDHKTLALYNIDIRRELNSERHSTSF